MCSYLEHRVFTQFLLQQVTIESEVQWNLGGRCRIRSSFSSAGKIACECGSFSLICSPQSLLIVTDCSWHVPESQFADSFKSRRTRQHPQLWRVRCFARIQVREKKHWRCKLKLLGWTGRRLVRGSRIRKIRTTPDSFWLRFHKKLAVNVSREDKR